MRLHRKAIKRNSGFKNEALV